ncbi:MAG: acetylornithine aminotransferase [Candidatus Magnetoglobus multicellularis str. Araruama]|uniref:Acetylornithine aminotransferase n=1 Tax=Candidatus Magnetoglobus multicellularis str. Araruama TaxID=890399 RepID=A0A1V1P7W5_9BACT|nr:MAG: acetylornithine aminotransferase [Candidatus Magnetoglobus multicellularis str. Araruama]
MMQTHIHQADQVIMQTYARVPVVFVKGSECTLWDASGKMYKDFLAGIAVCNLGHANPVIAQKMSQQAANLVHVSNLFYTLPQMKLSKKLVDKSFADRVFLCNSGAEANEAAIKLARKYFHDLGQPKRNIIISAIQSFHGRTYAAMSVTGQDKIQKGFHPLLPGFKHVPFNDIEALKNLFDDNVCAVMLEPIQGEGGVCCPSDNYLKQVRQLCDQHDALLIFDEIQTGMGRTGKLFAYEHFDVQPDIMTLAKALANGLPMGAMLSTEKIAKAFGPGSHATTFGGTPLVASVALCVLEYIEDKNIIEHCQSMGAYFKQKLLTLKEKYSCILDVQGYGLMIGMPLSIKGAPIVNKCMEKGFVINCIQDHILRFVPPLIIQDGEIDALIDCLDVVFQEVNK